MTEKKMVFEKKLVAAEDPDCREKQNLATEDTENTEKTMYPATAGMDTVQPPRLEFKLCCNRPGTTPIEEAVMEICVVPRARYMIICDAVLQDEQRPGKLTIVGLTSLVVWPSGAVTPVRLERFVVLLILTDGRGAGMGRIICLNEETGLPVFGSPATRISFEGKNPLGHYGVIFQLHDCRFPDPGTYVVQFLFDDTLVQEQLVTVR